VTALAQLTASELAFALIAVFVAGMVRGFAGFALSALVMASLASMIPPVELIPVCTMLELASAMLLLRGGFGEANKRMAFTLQAGALIGVPTGLYLTKTLDPELSKIIALCLVVTLALLQLARVRLPVSPSPVATFVTGITSGFVTGLASIGGMVIALYTLALQMPPKNMRGSLILIIFIGGTLTFLWQILYGMITELALTRFAIFALPMLAGVLIGRANFKPEYERFYRPFCLTLLIGLGAAGLLRTVL
jgi:uncharacterized protein